MRKMKSITKNKHYDHISGHTVDLSFQNILTVAKNNNVKVREWSANQKILVYKYPHNSYVKEVGITIERNNDNSYGFAYWQVDERHPKDNVNIIATAPSISESEARLMMYYMAKTKINDYFEVSPPDFDEDELIEERNKSYNEHRDVRY